VKTKDPSIQLWSEIIPARLTNSPTAGVLLVAESIWLLGLLASVVDNKALFFLSGLPTYGLVFLLLPALFLGARYFHRSYLIGIDEFQPHTKLPSEEFSKLKSRLDRMLCDSRIVFMLGILAFVVLEDNFAPIRDAIVKSDFSGIPLSTPVKDLGIWLWIWALGLSSVEWLLFVTAIWLVISIWIGIYYISKQPLNFTPARFSNEFHDLAMVNLKVTGFYFLGISIALLLNLYATKNLFSVVFFYVLLAAGAFGFFAPHYNIHLALVKGKREELERLDKEIVHFAKKLDSLHATESQNPQEYLRWTARVISLQANERRIAEADDWPLDHGQLSTFLILIIIPILLNLITNPLP
jgi:hypothetical protein